MAEDKEPPKQPIVADKEKAKQLAHKFADAFLEMWNGKEYTRADLAVQMLTAIAACKITISNIAAELKAQGFEFAQPPSSQIIRPKIELVKP